MRLTFDFTGVAHQTVGLDPEDFAGTSRLQAAAVIHTCLRDIDSTIEWNDEEILEAATEIIQALAAEPDGGEGGDDGNPTPN